MTSETNAVAIPTQAVDAASTTTLKGAEAITNGHPVDMSIIGMFMQADIIVQLVMLMLLAASFWGWVIIFDKLAKFRTLKRKTAWFEETFWSGEPLEALYERIKHTADHPMARVFVAGMYEWMNGNRKKAAEEGKLAIGLQGRIVQAMNIERNREIGVLEKNLSFLATTGSAAPFIGLFGTVWGIMNSFQSIALMKNTSLDVVAPGIAEALLATAIGLFAAIPAVIFYNKFTNDLNQFSNQLDEFVDEFSAIIARELDE